MYINHIVSHFPKCEREKAKEPSKTVAYGHTQGQNITEKVGINRLKRDSMRIGTGGDVNHGMD